jgi:23S rRNA (guanosine2251-2'-O)-methyltransferase
LRKHPDQLRKQNSRDGGRRAFEPRASAANAARVGLAGRAPAYVACGVHAARAFVLARPDHVERILLERNSSPELTALAAARGIAIEHADPAALGRIAQGVVHQGVVAVGRPPAEHPLEALVADRRDMVIALDGVTDPRNAGAILRSAEAAGVGAVVIGRDRAPGLSPALVKAAAGAVEWLPVARVTNLARSLEELSAAGYWLIGLAEDADRELYDTSATPGFPLVLILGSEGAGLRPIIRRACHRLLRIPMRGRTESLNVSVAAAVAIFELRRAVETGRQPR